MTATARDEILAAATAHGWRRVRPDSEHTFRKGSRRCVHLGFDVYGRVTHLSVTTGGGHAYRVATGRHAAALAELTR